MTVNSLPLRRITWSSTAVPSPPTSPLATVGPTSSTREWESKSDWLNALPRVTTSLLMLR